MFERNCCKKDINHGSWIGGVPWWAAPAGVGYPLSASKLFSPAGHCRDFGGNPGSERIGKSWPSRDRVFQLVVNINIINHKATIKITPVSQPKKLIAPKMLKADTLENWWELHRTAPCFKQYPSKKDGETSISSFISVGIDEKILHLHQRYLRTCPRGQVPDSSSVGFWKPSKQIVVVTITTSIRRMLQTKFYQQRVSKQNDLVDLKYKQTEIQKMGGL